jgi:F-type H+-transporting ATPase subunit gamma
MILLWQCSENCWFVNGEIRSGDYDKIELIYNQFKKCCNSNCSNEQFYHWQFPYKNLPASTGDYIFEPSKEEIRLTLIPKSLNTIV